MKSLPEGGGGEMSGLAVRCDVQSVGRSFSRQVAWGDMPDETIMRAWLRGQPLCSLATVDVLPLGRLD